MSVRITGIISSLRAAWQDVNPLAPGVSFSTQDFLEDRIYELEQQVTGLKRELSDAKAQLRGQLIIAPSACSWSDELGA